MERLVRGVCEQTGVPFDYRRTHKKSHAMRLFSPSLDRIDPSLGYTQDNCQVVVIAYNLAKQSGTDREMRAMCMSMAARVLETEVRKLLGKK